MLPDIVEKAFAVEEETSVPSSPEGWKSGGVVRRKQGKLASVTEVDEGHDALDEQIICAYDVVSSGAAYHDLRYVLDVQQKAEGKIEPALFEQQHGLPATLSFFEQQPRNTVNDFTRDVFA